MFYLQKEFSIPGKAVYIPEFEVPWEVEARGLAELEASIDYTVTPCLKK